MNVMNTILRAVCAVLLAGCGTTITDVFGADADLAAMCTNDVKDGFESDVDCGGQCAPCLDGQMCEYTADCANVSCVPTLDEQDKHVGRCWGPDFVGYAEVAVDEETSVTMCSDMTLTLCPQFVDGETWAACFAPRANAVPWTANFMCCPDGWQFAK